MALLSTTAPMAIMAPAVGADITWTNGAGNQNWFVTGNWDTNSVPDNTDNVFIDTIAGAPEISSDPFIAKGNVVTIGNAAAGKLSISGIDAGLYAGSVILGVGGVGHLLVDDEGRVESTDAFVVGQDSQGFATFSDYALLLAGGLAYVGYEPTATGELSFSGGAGGVFSSIEGLNIGYFGAGTLSVDTNAFVDVYNLTAGYQPGSQGTINVHGAGSTIYVGNTLNIGHFGIGSLNVDGGMVTVANNANPIRLGFSMGSVGLMKVSNHGVLSLGNNMFMVGDAGVGVLEIESAGTVSADFLMLGNQGDAIGFAKVSGAGSALAVATGVVVGTDGIGYLTIADGGTVDINAGAGALTLAQNAGSQGLLVIGSNNDAYPATAGHLAASSVEFGAGEGALILFHTDTDYTFAAALTGDGKVLHATGVTTLTGDSSGFTGTTGIFSGTLKVNGILGGDVGVGELGTLGGSGNVGNVINFGNIAPGNSIGILNVADLTMNAGSVYTVELNDSGNIAGINNDIISATGAVTINGGTVYVTPENGIDAGSSYVPGTTYHIIHSTNSVTGTFDNVIDDYAFLSFALSYDANNVFLTSSVVTSLCLAGMTKNECATADGLFSLPGGGLLAAVAGLSDAEAPFAMDQLSGEIYASARTVLVEDSRFVREAALDRLHAALANAGQGDTDGGGTFWARGFGSLGQWNGDGNAAALDRDIGGFFLGGDATVGDAIRLGLMGGYSRSSFDVDERASSGDADTWTIAAYAGRAWEAFSLAGGAAASWHSIDTARSVAFTGFSDSLSADYGARTAQAFGEAAYGLDAASARFELFGNLAYVNLSTDGFTEDGGAAALAAGGENTDTVFSTLGLRAQSKVAVAGMDATLRGAVGWRHAEGDVDMEQSLAFAGGDVFTVAGVPVAEDTVTLDAGFELGIGANAKLGLRYNGQFGSGVSDQGLRADFAMGF